MSRCLIVISLFILFMVSGVDAAIFNVNDTTSFQNALTSAQNNGDDDTIFVTQIINVSSTLTYVPTENQSLTIIGTGFPVPILDGGNIRQILNIDTTGLGSDSNAHIIIRNLDFQDATHTVGDGDGGALFIHTNSAEITIEDCAFSTMTADQSGGAVYAETEGGTVTFNMNTVTGTNTATNGRGGAIYIHVGDGGTLFFTNNTISGTNTSTGFGGAVYTSGAIGGSSLTITDNNISGTNRSLDSGGGAIYANTSSSTENMIIFSNNIISGTNTADGSGGAVHVNTGTAIFTNNTIRGTNSSTSSRGGGLYLNTGGGPITFTGNTISGDNSAATTGGGAHINGGTGSIIEVINNTITGTNYAAEDGGGLRVTAPFEGTLYLINNTVTGNTADNLGGGVYINASGITNIYNNIIRDNTANEGGNDGDDLYVDSGDGETVNLFNNDLGPNADFVTASSEDLVVTNITSYSHGNNITDDPNLGPLQNNGGPTETRALSAGSPAIDTGDNTIVNTLGVSTDQRGYVRIWDGDGNGSLIVDIGAYEFNAPPYTNTADSILFPWVVRSNTVTTLISVVNTAQSIAEACGLPFDHPGELHWEYYYKTDFTDVLNGQTDYCEEINFYSDSSKDDMVTFDVAGVFNTGQALFNDNNETEFVPDFTLPVENPRRAFLLVDNNTDAYIDPDSGFRGASDGTLYGEAMIIERGSGAAVGYIAYNASGGVENGAPCFADDDNRDMLGEVIGDDETGRCEMAPVTILPASLVTTKFLVTPTSSENNEGMGGTCDISNQRMGNLNAIVQLCASPGPDPEDPDCDCPPGGGGVWNNTEGKISFNVRKNIVCTSGDDISAFMGTVGYERFENTGQAGWTYVDADRGTLAGGDDAGPYCETDEFIIAKVEYAEGDTMFDGASITNPPGFVDPSDLFVNNMVWLRNNRNYIDHCTTAPSWRCDPNGGLNLLHNQTDDCPLGGPAEPEPEAPSDERWKKNIKPLTASLDKVMLLEGVSYDWKADEYPEMRFTTDRQIGFIAQDVEEVFPELVTTDSNGYKAIYYAQMVAVLLEAMKEQQAEISELKKQQATIAELKEKIAQLENKLEQK